MYDDTKFEAAFKAWMEANVEIGYGEHYAGDLLDDFDRFMRETKMMKSNPGRVRFGMELKKIEYLETRKRLGLTYWIGLSLKNPPERDALEPKRHYRTLRAQARKEKEIKAIQEAEEFDNSPEAEKARLAAFKRELKSETRENIAGVGKDD